MTQNSKTTTARRIAAIVAVPLVAGLVLSGCTASAPTSAPSTSRSAPTGSSASPAALADAAKTAGAVTGSGTVISIEQEAGGSSWEVLVVADDGSEQEVHVSADGSSVIAGPTAKTSDAGDLAENVAFLAAAKIGVSKASELMRDAVAGSVTELGLDDHQGAVVWEGDVVDSANQRHSIRLDAGSGNVVTNSVDTDD